MTNTCRTYISGTTSLYRSLLKKKDLNKKSRNGIHCIAGVLIAIFMNCILYEQAMKKCIIIY